MNIHELPSAAAPVYANEIAMDNGTATQRVNFTAVADLMNQRRTVIPDGSDLNEYTTPGSYYCLDSTSAGTMVNAPITDGNFRLEVISGGLGNYATYVMQFCWGTTNNSLYMRRKNSGWSSWTRFYNTLEDSLGSQISEEPSTATLSNNTVTQIGSGITLPAGRWSICAGIKFDSNSTGRREFYLTRGDGSPWIVEHVNSNAVSGDATYLNIGSLAVLSSDTVFKMKARQNSGGSLGATARIYAARIG